MTLEHKVDIQCPMINLQTKASAPATPNAGQVSIYAKTDKKAYIKNEDGNEVEIGGGGGSGVKKYTTPSQISQNGTIVLSDANSVLDIYDFESSGSVNEGINYNTRNEYTESDAVNGTTHDGSKFTLKGSYTYNATSYTSTNVVPNMTGMSSPSGNVILSDNWSGATNAWRIFNSDLSTYEPYITGAAVDRWIGFELPSPLPCNKLGIIPSTSYFSSTATINGVRFEGRLNNTWFTIGQTTGITGWSAGVEKTFTYTNNTIYDAYRIYILSSWYNSVANLYIGQIKFYLTGGSGTPYPLNTAYSVTTTNASQIQLSNVSSILSLTYSGIPVSTYIKSLISLDGRNTWLGWDGLEWAEVANPIYDNATDMATFAGNITDLDITGASTIDLKSFLYTTNNTLTPLLNQITFTFGSTTQNYTPIVKNVDWSIGSLSGKTIADFTNNNLGLTITRLKATPKQMAIVYV